MRSKLWTPPGALGLPAVNIFATDSIRYTVPALPIGWVLKQRAREGLALVRRRDQTTVIFSIRIEEDSRTWLHLSCSRPDRCCNWEELAELKELFLPNLLAFQLLPTRDEWVNIHPRCLHLWACLDDRPIPDFRRFIDGQAVI